MKKIAGIRASVQGSTGLLHIGVMVIFVVSLLMIYPRTTLHAAPGVLDPSFGSGGKVVTDLGGPSDAAGAVAIQADGRIIVGGTQGSLRFAVLRYRADGSLDTSFGLGGLAVADFGTPSEQVSAIAIMPNGKIVAGGFVNAPNVQPDDFALARFNSNGSLDTSFGVGGKITTDFLGGFDDLAAMAVDPSGRIVATGVVQDTGGIGYLFATARYDVNGNLDASFGSGGKVLQRFPQEYGVSRALALQPDGKVVVAGNIAGEFGTVRYDDHGNLDPTFGVGGVARGGILGLLNEVFSVAIQPDGKIVEAGYAFLSLPEIDFCVARYNPDGSLDASFGVGGQVVTSFGTSAKATAVALAPGGKIVAGGSVESTLVVDFALARYDSNGVLDTTFGTGGKTTTDFSGRSDYLYGIAVEPDSRIIAVGQTWLWPTAQVAAARYGDAPFDLCVQDDSSGSNLQVKSTTGEYLFRSCGGVTVGGTGSITRRGSVIMLQQVSGDRRVQASIDTSTRKATAVVQLLSQGTMFSLMDRNISDNLCACP